MEWTDVNTKTPPTHQRVLVAGEHMTEPEIGFFHAGEWYMAYEGMVYDAGDVQFWAQLPDMP